MLKYHEVEDISMEKKEEKSCYDTRYQLSMTKPFFPSEYDES